MDTSSFIGEIRAFPYNFTPVGWLLCDGSQVNVRSYQALFAVIGNIYGSSDMQTYFTLPNLQGQVPMGANAANVQKLIGKKGGNETATIVNSNLPSHSHTAYADKKETTEQTLATQTPGPNVFLSNMIATTANATPVVFTYVDYTSQTTNVVANTGLIGISAGNGQPHDNMMPYLSMRLCICWDGIYPTKD